MVDKADRRTEARLKEIEDRIESIFSEASEELKADFKKQMAEFAKADKKNLADLARLEKGTKEYEEARRELISNRQKKLLFEKQAQARIDGYSRLLTDKRELAYAVVTENMPEIYALNYNFISPDIIKLASDLGISQNLVNSEVLKNIVIDNLVEFPAPKVERTKAIVWSQKAINRQISQGIIQGESMDEIAERLGKVSDMTGNQTIATARTCVTSAENQGRNDRFNNDRDRFKKYGISVKKVWSTRLDGRERPSHKKINMTAANKKGFFANGLRYPGDLEHGSYGDWMNCRCSLLEVPYDDKDGKPLVNIEEKDVAKYTKAAKDRPKKEEEKGIDRHYSMRELDTMNRENLKELARKATVTKSKIDGTDTEEMLRRYELLVDANSDSQLRKYINKIS